MEIKWLSYVPMYIALCEEKSIAGAAKKLRCSNAHASRQLRQLEEILSVQLIQRTTRQFNLTYDGLRFYQQVKGLMDGAEEINEQVMESDRVAGHLRIAASASFGAALLNRALIEFRQLYPEVTFEVIFSETPLDLIESGFDVAFFFTNNPPEAILATICALYTVNHSHIKRICLTNQALLRRKIFISLTTLCIAMKC